MRNCFLRLGGRQKVEMMRFMHGVKFLTTSDGCNLRHVLLRTTVCCMWSINKELVRNLNIKETLNHVRTNSIGLENPDKEILNFLHMYFRLITILYIFTFIFAYVRNIFSVRAFRIV
jgi:hypothetical protein